MLAALEQVGCVAEGDQRADRDTARDALGDGDRIRYNTGALEGEPRARPPDTRLDLIKDEQRAVLGGELTGALKETGRKINDPGLSLDGFDEDCGNRLIDRGLERLDRRVDVLDTRQQRFERLAQRGLAGQRQ